VRDPQIQNTKIYGRFFGTGCRSFDRRQYFGSRYEFEWHVHLVFRTLNTIAVCTHIRAYINTLYCKVSAFHRQSPMQVKCVDNSPINVPNTKFHENPYRSFGVSHA
jgi:hypothetical protein